MRQEHEGKINTGLEVHILKHSKDERIGSQRLRVVEENPQVSEEVLWMKSLFPEDRRIRASSTGGLYIASYRSGNEDEYFDEALVATGQVKPKVAFRRWSRYEDIPTARRGVRAIKGSYEKPEGHEYAQLREVSSLIRFGISEIQRGSIRNVEDMQALSELIAEGLVTSGYDTVVKPEKKEVRERVMRALATVDSLNRFNPSRSRMLLNYALLETVPLFIFEGGTKDKYQNLYDKLTREDSMERFYLEQGRKLLLEFMGSKRRQARRSEYDNKAVEVEEYVRGFMSDSVIKVAPYKKAAVLTRLMVIGPQSGHERRELEDMGIGSEELESFHIERPVKFEKRGIRELILSQTVDVINRALDEGERKFEGTWVEPETPVPQGPDKDPFERYERAREYSQQE